MLLILSQSGTARDATKSTLRTLRGAVVFRLLVLAALSHLSAGGTTVASAIAAEQSNKANAAGDAQGLLRDGMEHRKHGRYQEAVVALSKALRADPELPSAHTHRGFCYRALGMPDEALADFREALRLNPRSVPTLYYRSLVHYDLRDYLPALDDLAQAEKLDPRFPRVPYQRARVYAALGRIDEAMAACNHALELDPRYARALEQRAQLHLDLEDVPKAQADLDRAIELSPQVPAFFSQRGLLRQRARKYEQAITDFNRALKLDALDPWPRYNRALCLAALGRAQEAVTDLTEVLHRQPTNCNAYYARAAGYRALGQTERADADFAEGERVGPLAQAKPPSEPLFRSAPGEKAAATANVVEPRSKRIIRATGFLVGFRDKAPQSLATCWVVDEKQRLAVTNFHAIHNPELFVYFARFDEGGRVFSSPLFYLRQPTQIKAWVLARDPRRDLALLRLSRLPEETAALPLAEAAPTVGEPVYSMGNSSAAAPAGLQKGKLWKYRQGKVLQLTSFRLIRLSNFEQQLEAGFVETDSGVEGGDSGGPLCSAEGKAVGVISGRQTEGEKRSYAIALSELRGFLKDRGIRRPTGTRTVVGVWLFTIRPKEGKGGDRFARFTFQDDGKVLLESDTTQEGKYRLQNDKLYLDLPRLKAEVPISWNGNDRFSAAFIDGKATFDRRR